MVDDRYRKMVEENRRQQAEGLARRAQAQAEQAEDKRRAELGLKPLPRHQPEWAKDRPDRLDRVLTYDVQPNPGKYSIAGPVRSLNEQISEALAEIPRGPGPSEPYIREQMAMDAKAKAEWPAKQARLAAEREITKAARAKELHNKRMAKYRKAKRILPIKPSNNFDDV